MSGHELADCDRRLALNFAPAEVRAALRTLWSFDETLGRAVAASREPMLGQIRLAWWRDQLRDPGAAKGDDPLLGALAAIPVDRSALIAMVDGWEELLAPMPLSDGAITAYAKGRGGASFRASAALLGDVTPAREVGAGWAAIDFARHCSDADTAARAQVIGRDSLERADMPRARPLRILTSLARSDTRRAPGEPRSRWALLRATLL